MEPLQPLGRGPNQLFCCSKKKFCRRFTRLHRKSKCFFVIFQQQRSWLRVSSDTSKCDPLFAVLVTLAFESIASLYVRRQRVMTADGVGPKTWIGEQISRTLKLLLANVMDDEHGQVRVILSKRRNRSEALNHLLSTVLVFSEEQPPRIDNEDFSTGFRNETIEAFEPRS